MATVQQPVQLGHRYQLLDVVGSGSMGTVYRAYDRLTKSRVAIKRVKVDDTPSTQEYLTAPDTALAHEFHTLASLHHPHIVKVRDYGFDERTNRQPYFVMELLENTRTIVSAGQRQSLEIQIRLLIDLLDALRYLHQMGMLHRDLKPTNVLVCDKQVKVLDFGLAVNREQAVSSLGTLAYMAPELLHGGNPDITTDLYAVGIIAYEILAGLHPFDTSAINNLARDILYKDMDDQISNIKARHVVQKLLAKLPGFRFQSADQVIEAFRQVVDPPLITETQFTREPLLHVPRFVGRTQEITCLSEALQRAVQGEGSAWLIGGESGVGKSRLLNELRILALTQGVFVLQGYNFSATDIPYQLWRDPLRHLTFTTEFNPSEIQALSPLVPDINGLADPLAPEQLIEDPAQAHERLMQTIVSVFRRQGEPILLLLEDLQWAEAESLSILKTLISATRDRPLLIVGSFRDSEYPNLPSLLPYVHCLSLQRFTHDEITAFSQTILGQVGKQPALVDLLQRETEGNAFFLIEVIRSLVASTKPLTGMGEATLTEGLSAHKIDSILQRRLEKVPPAARPLLSIAAVLGRTIDMDVLGAAAPDVDLDSWLITCAGLGVLEIHDGRWRFSHHKLCEFVLSGLADRPHIHERAAKALEARYAHSPNFAASLAYHWTEAGNPAKAFDYLFQATDHAICISLYEKAVAFGSQALAAQVSTSAHIQGMLHYMLGRAHEGLSHYGESQGHYREALKLAQVENDRRLIADVLTGLAAVTAKKAAYSEAVEYCQTALRLYVETNEPYLQWRTFDILGDTHRELGHVEEAQRCHEAALAICVEHDDWRGQATSLLSLAKVAVWTGMYEKVNTAASRALELAQLIGDKALQANAYHVLGTCLHNYLTNYDQAIAYLEHALCLWKDVGNLRGQVMCLNSLAVVLRKIDQGPLAMRYLEQILRLNQELGDPAIQIAALVNMGIVYNDLGNLEQYAICLEQALTFSQDSGTGRSEGTILSNLSNLYYELGQYERSIQYSEQAFAISRRIKNQLGEARTYINQGFAYAGFEDYQTAIEYMQQGLVFAIKLNVPELISHTSALLTALYLHIEKLDHARRTIEVGYHQAPSIDRYLAIIMYGLVQAYEGKVAEARITLLEALDAVQPCVQQKADHYALYSWAFVIACLAMLSRGNEQMEYFVQARRAYQDAFRQGSAVGLVAEALRYLTLLTPFDSNVLLPALRAILMPSLHTSIRSFQTGISSANDSLRAIGDL